MNVFDPVPGDGFARVAIVVPGHPPDASRSLTVGVTSGCQAVTCSRIAVIFHAAVESPVVNFIPTRRCPLRTPSESCSFCPVLPIRVCAPGAGSGAAAARVTVTV